MLRDSTAPCTELLPSMWPADKIISAVEVCLWALPAQCCAERGMRCVSIGLPVSRGQVLFSLRLCKAEQLVPGAHSWRCTDDSQLGSCFQRCGKSQQGCLYCSLLMKFSRSDCMASWAVALMPIGCELTANFFLSRSDSCCPSSPGGPLISQDINHYAPLHASNSAMGLHAADAGWDNCRLILVAQRCIKRALLPCWPSKENTPQG